jgi:hypothetical protein
MKSEIYEITMLYARLPPLIAFEPTGNFHEIRQGVPYKTLTQCFLIPWLQPFQNGGRPNYHVDAKLKSVKWDHCVLYHDLSTDEELVLMQYL